MTEFKQKDNLTGWEAVAMCQKDDSLEFDFDNESKWETYREWYSDDLDLSPYVMSKPIFSVRKRQSNLDRCLEEFCYAIRPNWDDYVREVLSKYIKD